MAARARWLAERPLHVAAEPGSVVVLIACKAGVGNSRLGREFATCAEARGFGVCVGRCVESGKAMWPQANRREVVACHAEALLAGTAGRADSVRRAATDAVGVACAAAHEVDATPLLIAIDHLADRAGLSVGGHGPFDPRRDEDRAVALGLTPREHEVLMLLACGRSSGEIGTTYSSEPRSQASASPTLSARSTSPSASKPQPSRGGR